MASEAKVPPEIKKNVRAVLLSMIGGVSLEKFQSDYRTLVAGQPLDPPRLGFCSLLDFLKAMPDVVRWDVTWVALSYRLRSGRLDL